MKNPGLFFWGSFGGAIVVVLAIVAFYSFQNSNRMSGLSETYAHWNTVQGKINSFEARFPKEPEYASEELAVPNSEQKIQQEMYVSGSESVSYFISASLYPEDLTGGEESNLKAVLGGMIQTISGAQVLSSSYIVPFSGSNYLEFEFLNPNDATHFKGRLYIEGMSMYQTYSSYQETSYNDDEYTYFVNSFVTR